MRLEPLAAVLLVLWGAVALSACGAEPAAQAVLTDSAEADVEQRPMARVMPDYPTPVRGRLVTRSAGHEDLDGEWPARAGTCEESQTLRLIAGEERAGTILLFYLPPEGERATSYPVVPVDSTVPEPPAVRAGIQLLGTRMGDSYQAFDGTVEVTELDRRVSGRLALHVRNIDTRDTVLYAGVFEGVRVRPLPEEECATAEEPAELPDSLADSSEADSLD